MQKSIEAARNTGLSVEIIDLRTLNPLDMETILSSLQNTNRAIVAHEDNLNNGFGAEIAARISDEGFTYLDAPIKRVASKDAPVAYAEVLENETFDEDNNFEQDNTKMSIVDHILLDEAQDCLPIQLKLFSIICKNPKNYTFAFDT